MIEVTNLVKKYGSHMALDHLNFTIEKGKIYGFLGPNGAGKSTTMNILTGYLQPTEGSVLIDGIDIGKKPEKAKEKIGYLPETPPLYQDMTVREYFEFAAGLKKVARKQRKSSILAVSELTGIKEYENVLIRKLSKGYRQRVGMAQAILGEPEIIILDEPTVGLDPKQIKEIRKLIKMLGKEHTVILSSHILSEVSAVCDEIIIISNGKLVAQDTPKNLEEKQDTRQVLLITVKGEETQIRSALSELENVEKCALLEESVPGEWKYQLTAKAGCDLREELSFHLAKQRMPILEMSESRVSLEDVFLKLTAAEKEDQEEDHADSI